jgi:hypothetical protein
MTGTTRVLVVPSSTRWGNQDTLAYTTLVWPSETKVGVRVQLKKAGYSGKWGPMYVNYKKKYRGQLDNIVKGMFPQNQEAGDPKNWRIDFNSIMGGQGYQHPHSDHVRAGTYKKLKRRSEKPRLSGTAG